ncbi:MAG: hypothetical protein LBB98_08370 [Treponema sp.]|jgi:hypothetical protein|nr:hypothetical protein [Treponema sp.]
MSQSFSSEKHLFVINPLVFPKLRDINHVIAEIVRCFDDLQAALQVSSGNILPRLLSFWSAESPYAIHIPRFSRDGISIIQKYIALVGGEIPAQVCVAGIQNIEDQIKASAIPTDIIDCGNIYALNSCAAGFDNVTGSRYYTITNIVATVYNSRRPMQHLLIANIINLVLTYFHNTPGKQEGKGPGSYPKKPCCG